MSGVSVGTGLAISGGVGAAGSMASGMMQAGAISDASQASNALQWNMYSQNRADLAPYRAAGTKAINYLGNATMPGGAYNKFTAADFQADPGYAWRKQQGLDAIRSGASATGMFGSGNMGTALEQYGQNFASNEYQNAYSRWQDSYNRIAGVAGIGQTAAQGTVNAGTNAANTMSGTTMQAGIGTANAYGNAFSGMNNSIQGGMGSYMNYLGQQQLMSAFGMNNGGNAGSDSGGSAWDTAGVRV